MKKLLILATLMAGFASVDVKAQIVNGIRLTDIKADYIQVRADERVLARTFFITIEYGQLTNDWENTVLKDDDGKKIQFNSALDFINKAKSYGYELFQVFTEGEKRDVVYLLKRK
ncbi:hypothetical protein [Pedobacter sp. MR22-3]|uniref:hypothetical protein n=1 Tax=Pedobacter sp. MR22-3 TaxID=2994552 RepID=UPI002245A267|nr:hypothetical protein [Pedobacter sp. MR22-3]MCX2582228.1 hypothetical protein [Pedobacter sp. MR22-3]